jgi:hypothetical protein
MEYEIGLKKFNYIVHIIMLLNDFLTWYISYSCNDMLPYN